MKPGQLVCHRDGTVSWRDAEGRTYNRRARLNPYQLDGLDPDDLDRAQRHLQAARQVLIDRECAHCPYGLTVAGGSCSTCRRRICLDCLSDLELFGDPCICPQRLRDVMAEQEAS